jgi:hypothetical protein
MDRLVRTLSLIAAGAALSFGASCTPKPATDSPDANADAATLEGGVIEGGAAREDGGADDESQPPTSSEELGTRMKHLVEAISQDNPDLAKDLLYPRDAYRELKDAKDPGKTWDKKVDTAFKRTVHRLHKRLKGNVPTFSSFAIGPGVELAKVKRSDIKKPAWRVRHSKVTFTADGKTHTIEIAEMTAYRGSWYVTRLR